MPAGLFIKPKNMQSAIYPGNFSLLVDNSAMKAIIKVRW